MTVVLLHPVALDVACWDMSGVAGERYEYPGNGTRPLPPSGNYTLEELADDIAATYPGMLDLVGLSMGASLAEYVALRHPDRVRSILVGAGGGGGRTAEEGRRQRQAGLPVPNEDRAGIQDRSTMAETLDWVLPRWFTPEAIAANHPGVEYTRRRWLANDPKGVAATWRANSAAIRDLLPTITQPATVLVGRFDRTKGANSRPVEDGEALAGLLPCSRLEILDGPHNLHLEVPQAFAAAVRRHFDWVAALERAAVSSR